MNEEHFGFIRKTIDLAQKARDKGNNPFGALLVNEQGNIIVEAENITFTKKDCTGHTETNLMRLASSKYDYDALSKCTLYTSTEPCAMCAGAIYWGGVQKVVFGLSMERYIEVAGNSLDIPLRDVFATADKDIQIIGPILEEEALVVQKDFW